MRTLCSFFLSLAAVICSAVTPAQAHFPWLVIEQSGSSQPTLQCYFSEAPVADNPDLLKRLSNAKYWQISGRKPAAAVELKLADESLSRELTEADTENLFLIQADLGVMTRGDKTFRLLYGGKTGPAITAWAWNGKQSREVLKLDAQPSLEEGELVVTVLFEGQPVAGAEVVLMSDLAPLDETLTTGENGQIRFSLADKSVHALRVKYVQAGEGEVDGKKFAEQRYYTTVTFPEASYHPLATSVSLPSIPETVTSFGAAVLNGKLYYYGGHTGSAHSYSDVGQANTLWELDLQDGKAWKPLAQGPRLQGLALVAAEGKLYRMGGFTAKNKEGEEHDLWSQTSFASYDPQTNKWTELAPLPEPRSSFDACVLNGKIYVIGGWSLEGEGENEWHKTAWSYDVNAAQPEWTSLPAPPFERRALSVAAHNDKIYAIGGMQSSGSPTVQTAVFDPAAITWSEGPRLIGGGMTGFGTSSFATNGNLYVSTYDGTLQKLSDDGKSWNLVGHLESARFFHRMLPLSEQQLVFLGGSNMQIGKFDDVEVLNLKKNYCRSTEY